MDWQKIAEHHEHLRKHLEEIDAENHEMKQMMTLCHFVGGIHDGKYMTEWQVEQKLCNGRHSYDGTETRKNGGLCHHAVLDNNPMVDGYLSPMWDGGMLRYETPEVYNMLSI